MNILHILALAMIATHAMPAFAADEKPLRVDILAFTQPGANGAAFWQDRRSLPPCHAVLLHDGTGAQSAFDGGQECEHKVGHDAAFGGFSAIGTSQLGAYAGKLKIAGYPLLVNRGWRQAPGNLSPVVLRGGRTAGTRQEFEGTLTVGGSDRMPEVALNMTLTRMEGDKPRYVTITDTRRLKPGEPAYFDHPLFGVIVAVSPADSAP